MTKKDIEEIINSCSIPDTCNNIELKETHMSWIIITDNYAFKIKRPVSFSFADFSTLEKRKHYCDKEVKLNKRLAPDMYVDVVPVSERWFSEDKTNGKVKDYAVKMERMDNEKEMVELLKENKVSANEVKKIAKKIARFHNRTDIVRNVFDVTRFQELYADILSVADFAENKLGAKWKRIMEENVEMSKKFLNQNRDYLNQRVISGFIRDCHGDLNAKNIFLYDDPVIFDCIEFNDEHRQIDIINDVAFLCVDLDFFDRPDLCSVFYNRYLDTYGTNDDEFTQRLFHYYKNYRANVRAKVTLLNAMNSDDEMNPEQADDVKKYLSLMNEYKNVFAEAQVAL